jgi:hypothetical protein
MVRTASQMMAKAQTELRKEDFDGGKAKSGVAMAMVMAPTKKEEAAAGVVEDLNVQAMAESGVRVVPPRFIRPAEELASFCPYTHVTLEPVPMIDIAGLFDFRRVFTMAAIASACRDWGCFQVPQHPSLSVWLSISVLITIRYVGLMWSLIVVGRLYVSGIWQGL